MWSIEQFPDDALSLGIFAESPELFHSKNDLLCFSHPHTYPSRKRGQYRCFRDGHRPAGRAPTKTVNTSRWIRKCLYIQPTESAHIIRTTSTESNWTDEFVSAFQPTVVIVGALPSGEPWQRFSARFNGSSVTAGIYADWATSNNCSDPGMNDLTFAS